MNAKQKPADAHPTTDSACQLNGATRNCSAPLYHAEGSAASPLDAVLDDLAARVAARMQSPPKDIWSAADLAVRYGVTAASIRAKMNAGEFGPLVHIDSRTRMVPWSGVQLYERTHCKPPERSVYSSHPRTKRRENPGPI